MRVSVQPTPIVGVSVAQTKRDRAQVAHDVPLASPADLHVIPEVSPASPAARDVQVMRSASPAASGTTEHGLPTTDRIVGISDDASHARARGNPVLVSNLDTSPDLARTRDAPELTTRQSPLIVTRWSQMGKFPITSPGTVKRPAAVKRAGTPVGIS